MNKLISITTTQLEWIKSEAKRLGISQIEVIRRLIDSAMEAKER